MMTLANLHARIALTLCAATGSCAFESRHHHQSTSDQNGEACRLILTWLVRGGGDGIHSPKLVDGWWVDKAQRIVLMSLPATRDSLEGIDPRITVMTGAMLDAEFKAHGYNDRVYVKVGNPERLSHDSLSVALSFHFGNAGGQRYRFVLRYERGKLAIKSGRITGFI